MAEFLSRSRTRTLARSAAACLVAVCGLSAAFAGGPLRIYDPAARTPYKWGPGTIPVYTDLGPMGRLSNERADELVAFALSQWSGVPTSTLEAAVAGDFASIGLPDITGANPTAVINHFNGGGIHVIYDTDGLIFQNFFGVSPFGILGIAFPEFADSTGTIVEATVVLNGRPIPASDPLGTLYAGVFTHEIGHSLNLAHSQTNGAANIWVNEAVGPATCPTPYSGRPTRVHVETMYPSLSISGATATGGEMSTVEQLDDRVSISNLYPAAGYPDGFATITGKVELPHSSDQISGVNIIARNVADPWNDAVSALSGDQSQGQAGPDGVYTFHGLTPGAQYVVYADRIINGGFSTPPSLFPGVEEYSNGTDEHSNPRRDKVCEHITYGGAAGETLTADIELNSMGPAPSWTPIGLPGGQGTYITADGITVAVNITGTSLLWNEETGVSNLGGTGSPNISPDGLTVIGNARDGANKINAGVWQGGTSWMPLGSFAGSTGCGSDMSSAFGVSNTGTVVGLGWLSNCRAHAFKWDSVNGMTDLGSIVSTRSSRANAIAGDGSLIVGWSDRSTGERQGAYFPEGGPPVWYTYPDGSTAGEASDVNNDGSIVVGIGFGLSPALAWKWTAAGGVETFPSAIPNQIRGFAFGVNDAGTVVAGRSNASISLLDQQYATIWTPWTGTRRLDSFLAAQGIRLDGYHLVTGIGVSSSGNRIAGWGLGPNNLEAWIADLSQVLVCHHGDTRKVDFPESFGDHMIHGDTWGPCTP